MFREDPLRRRLLGGGYSVRITDFFLDNIILITSVDLNLPLSAVAFVLVLFFLRVRTPEGSIGSKIKRVDWM